MIAKLNVLRPAKAKAISVIFCGSLLFGGPSYAQEATDNIGPDIFKGCEKTHINTGASNRTNPSSKIRIAAGKDESSKERIFRSFTLGEVSALDNVDILCWSRLDGLWREKMRVSFDKSVIAEGWASADKSTTDLAHGTYTEPDYVMLEVENDSNTISVIDGININPNRRTYSSSDNVTIEDVLATPLKEKRYQTQRGPDLRFSMSKTGRLRLKIGSRTFERPKPKISSAKRASNEDINEIFTVAYNPKNLGPTRQGYNIATQDHKNFSDNGGLHFIFAKAAPKNYYIEDQLTVPLGLELIPIEGRQGNIVYDKLVSSASAYQEENKSSLGVKAGLTAKGGGPEGVKRYEPASASFGHSNAREDAQGFSQNNTVATVTGYQRYKKFAFVRDHAYSELSNEFIDAIYDAMDSGSFNQIIEDFGTHYPYAVTYGSSGQLRTSMTEDSFSRNESSFKRDANNGGFSLGPLGASVVHDTSKAQQGSTSTTNKYGTSVFTAIGGNGSWDQNGFVAGDPAPILMDLRPIDQLLSPMNFPDEPEIYEDAREKLNEAVYAYLTSFERLSSKTHFPAPKHQYKIEIVELSCLRSGSKEKGSNVQIKGQINMRFSSFRGRMGKEMKGYDTTKHEGKKEYRVLTCPLKSSKNLRHSRRTRTFSVPESEISKLWWQLHVHLEELDWGLDAVDGREIIRRTPSGKYRIQKGMRVGQKLTTNWDIPRPAGHADYPKLRISVQTTRLK